MAAISWGSNKGSNFSDVFEWLFNQTSL